MNKILEVFYIKYKVSVPSEVRLPGRLASPFAFANYKVLRQTKTPYPDFAEFGKIGISTIN